MYLGSLTIDLNQRQIIHHGKHILLSKEEHDLLLLLISNPTDAIDKHTIAESIWNRRTARIESVKALVSNLRKKLQDPPTDPRYIKTVGRQGYQWIGGAPSTDKEAKFRGKLKLGIAGLILFGVIIGLGIILSTVLANKSEPILTIGKPIPVENVKQLGINDTQNYLSYYQLNEPNTGSELTVRSAKEQTEFKIKNVYASSWGVANDMLSVIVKSKDNAQCNVKIYHGSKGPILQSIPCPLPVTLTSEYYALQWLSDSAGILLASMADSNVTIWKYLFGKGQWVRHDNVSTEIPANDFELLLSRDSKITMVLRDLVSLTTQVYAGFSDAKNSLYLVRDDLRTRASAILDNNLFYISPNWNIESVDIRNITAPKSWPVILGKVIDLHAINQSSLVISYGKMPVNQVFFQQQETSRRLSGFYNTIRQPKLVGENLYFIAAEQQSETLYQSTSSGFKPSRSSLQFRINDIIDFDADLLGNSIILTANDIYYNGQPLNTNLKSNVEQLLGAKLTHPQGFVYTSSNTTTFINTVHYHQQEASLSVPLLSYSSSSNSFFRVNQTLHHKNSALQFLTTIGKQAFFITKDNGTLLRVSEYETHAFPIDIDKSAQDVAYRIEGNGLTISFKLPELKQSKTKEFALITEKLTTTKQRSEYPIQGSNYPKFNIKTQHLTHDSLILNYSLKH